MFRPVVCHSMSGTLMPIFHLFQEIIAMTKMAKNHRSAGDLNCMPKVAPFKVVILPILVKIANLDGKNGERAPEGWQFKLDAKSGPLESGEKGENGDFGKNGEFGTRAGDIQNVANILKGCHVAP